jgi:hypothetical protein
VVANRGGGASWAVIKSPSAIASLHNEWTELVENADDEISQPTPYQTILPRLQQIRLS